MAKKWVVLMVLVAVAAGGVFAQDNWISSELGLLGIGLRYERILNDRLSVGGNFFWNSFFFIWTSSSANVFARYYPWAGNFYGEIGLGYGTVRGTEEIEEDSTARWTFTTSGFMIAPGIGWKVDVGRPGGFYINPQISIPIVLGTRTNRDGDSEFKLGTNFRTAFGMGYAF